LHRRATRIHLGIAFVVAAGAEEIWRRAVERKSAGGGWWPVREVRCGSTEALRRERRLAISELASLNAIKATKLP